MLSRERAHHRHGLRAAGSPDRNSGHGRGGKQMTPPTPPSPCGRACPRLDRGSSRASGEGGGHFLVGNSLLACRVRVFFTPHPRPEREFALRPPTWGRLFDFQILKLSSVAGWNISSIPTRRGEIPCP